MKELNKKNLKKSECGSKFFDIHNVQYSLLDKKTKLRISVVMLYHLK